MRNSALLRGWGLGGVALLAGLGLLATDRDSVGIALIVVGVLVLGATGYGAATSMRVRMVVVDDAGVTVSVRGRDDLVLPWAELSSWEIGQVVGGKVVRGSSRGLLVWPKDQPAGSPAGPRFLWVHALGCWRVCQVLYIDGSEDELAAAMRHHLPERNQPG